MRRVVARRRRLPHPPSRRRAPPRHHPLPRRRRRWGPFNTDGLPRFDPSAIYRCKRLQIPSRSLFTEGSLCGFVVQQGGSSGADGELYWIPVQADPSASWPTPLDSLIPMSRRSVLYDPLCTPLGTLRGDLVVTNPQAALQQLFKRRQDVARLATLPDADGSNGGSCAASPPPSPPPAQVARQHRRAKARQRGTVQPRRRGGDGDETEELLC